MADVRIAGANAAVMSPSAIMRSAAPLRRTASITSWFARPVQHADHHVAHFLFQQFCRHIDDSSIGASTSIGSFGSAIHARLTASGYASFFI